MLAAPKRLGSARVPVRRARAAISGVPPENSVRRDAEHHTRGRVCSPDLPRNRGLSVHFSEAGFNFKLQAL